MTTYSPFELEPIFIDFKNESYNLGLDIQANQNDTLTLNFICRNNGIEEDMTKYKVELRVHNNNSNTDYIQTQNENVTLGTDGSVKIVCQSKNENKLTAYSGQCNGVLRIFNTENKQKATRIITMRIVADPLETDRANICESTITKLEDLDWILNEAYNIEDEFKKAIEEAIKQKAELTAKISESVTAKNNLNSTIQTANNTNKTLTDTNTTAINTKNELNTLNTTANNTKSNLDKSNVTALGTNKTLSDTNITAINTNNTLNATINNANNSKTALDTSKNNADKSKSALDGSVSNGNTLKTNLDGSIAIGTTLKTDIDNRLITGNKLKTDLDNSSTVATSKKEILDTANVQAEKNIETLNSFGDASQLTKDVTTLKTKVLENTLTSITTDSALTKLDNSENGFVRNMQILGKTLQNLWNNENVVSLKNDTMLIQTISTDDFRTNMLKDNIEYSIVNLSNKKTRADITTKNSNAYVKTLYIEPHSIQKFTISSQYISSFYGLISEGWTNTDSDKDIFKKACMILEDDYTNKEIPSYFEGIKSVGELDGNKISILTCGKNLIKNGNGENGLDFWIKRGNIVFSNFGEFTGNQWTGLDQILKVKQNTDYIISCNHSPNSNIFVMGVKSTGGNTLAFNTGNNNVITISLQSSVVGNQTVTFSEIQLVEGTTVAKYEPYKEDKTEILLPSPHAGLPSGVADIVNFDKSERIKNVGKASFIGSDNENWTINAGYTNDALTRFDLTNNNFNLKPNTLLVCNKFVSTILGSNAGEAICTHSVNQAICVYILKSKLETPDVAGFKKLLKTWADAGTPLEVYYQLANPVTEKLNIKDTLQTFQDGYIMLDNAITPTVQLEYSTNLPSAIGSLTEITDKLVDDVTNVEITISDMDAEIGEARKGKTTLEERLEEDRTNILNTIGQVNVETDGDIATQLNLNSNILTLPDSLDFNFKSWINTNINDKHMQGMCYVKKDNCLLIAYSDLNTAILLGNIVKYNLTTNTVTNTYLNIAIGHANDMAYREDTNEIYITSIYTNSGKNSITILDYSDMSVKSSHVFSEIPKTISVIGIAINTDGNIIVLTVDEILVYDKDFVFIKKFNNNLNLGNGEHLIVQGIDTKDDFIFILTVECIEVYNLYSEKLIKKYQVNKIGEVEGIAYIENKLLISNIIPNVEDKYTTTRLFEINLESQYDNWKWHTYSTLEELGLVVGQETIEKICLYMANKSILIFPKTGANTSNIYPSINGILEVIKYDKLKIRLNFYDTLTDKSWTAFYNNDISNRFSGWKINLIEDTGWLDLPLSNGISSVSGYTCQYRKIGKMIKLRGVITNMTSLDTIATLPTGYRPSVNSKFLISINANNGVYAQINVEKNGNLILGFTSQTLTPTMGFYLDPIEFSIE